MERNHSGKKRKRRKTIERLNDVKKKRKKMKKILNDVKENKKRKDIERNRKIRIEER